METVKEKNNCPDILEIDYLKLTFGGRISRITHDIFYKDFSQSICSRAYSKKDEHYFWNIFVRIIGHKHCYESYCIHRCM